MILGYLQLWKLIIEDRAKRLFIGFAVSPTSFATLGYKRAFVAARMCYVTNVALVPMSH